MAMRSPESLPSSELPDAFQNDEERMKTLMTRRDVLAVIGIATLFSCRRSERDQPARSQKPDSTVTLIVDGMI